MSLESCPLTPSLAPHCRSQRELDKEGDLVRESVPFCSVSILQSFSGSLCPWIKSWLLGLALKSSFSLVPGNLSAFLPPAPPIYAEKATHTFCVSLAVSHPYLLLPTFLPCRTPMQPLSPSRNIPAMTPQISLALDYPFMADIVMRSHSLSSVALSHLGDHSME